MHIDDNNIDCCWSVYGLSMVLFAKKWKQLETLIQTMRIYNHDIGMEFGKD